MAVCPEQPSHFNSHPPQPPRANVVVVAKPTWTTALRAANVIIVRHVSHLMKNEKKILQRGFRTRTHPTYTAKREYHSIPASTKLNLVELLRNTFVFSRLLFPWVCYLRVAKSPFFINCKCRVLLFLLSNEFSFKLYEIFSYLEIFICLIYYPGFLLEEYLRMREINLMMISIKISAREFSVN